MVDQLTSRSVKARPRIASGIAPWMVELKTTMPVDVLRPGGVRGRGRAGRS